MLAGVLFTVAALAAPAPLPKPSAAWTKGWDRPVLGKCRFDRHWDKVVFTVPGKEHGLNDGSGVLYFPRMLRPVDGDFDLKVRIGGDFHQTELADGEKRRAGVLITFGKAFCAAARMAWGKDPRSPSRQKRCMVTRGEWNLDSRGRPARSPFISA
jgi:hypothetical protein